MSSRAEMKAIVLTCDRYRAITEHMILQYERSWPDHPFIFQIPYQDARGTDTTKTNYHKTPEDIKGTVLHLLADVDDEEWIYWCVDDKYPVRLVTGKKPPSFLSMQGHIAQPQTCPVPRRDNQSFRGHLF